MSMPEVGELVTMIELRDYFAAKAMQGMLADSAYNGSGVAIEAYIIADAMLKAREQND